MKRKKCPSQEKLREMFSYNPLNGDLIWIKKVSNNTKLGTKAGGPHNSGYRVVHVDHVKYMEHRIIWIYHNGDIPDAFEVDHIDNVKNNNKIENLRLVTTIGNMRKKNLMKNNTTGYNGVYKVRGKYEAKIRVDKQLLCLGRFATIDEAIKARKEADIKYGFHEDHGNEPKKAKCIPNYNKASSGIKGVYYHKNKKTWDAIIQVNKKRMHLGSFKIKDDAIKARRNAELKFAKNT